VGYAEQSHPQHLIRMKDPIFDTNDTRYINNKTKTESEWYVILAPLVEQVYDRLMCKPSTRRVVCLLKPYAPTAFQNALQQHLWNRGVPGLVHLDTLQVVPMAQGWKRGLVVHVSREEAICVCHADGYVIPYTYQMVPVGYKALLEVPSSVEEETKESATSTTCRLPMPASSESKMDETLLNPHDPNSLVVAILMCLQECPRDLRAHVVSNIVFCGDGVALFPDLPRRVVKKVEQLLQDEKSTEEEEPQQQQSTTAVSTGGVGGGPVFAMVPLDTASLRPLGPRLILSSTAPYRADWISWVGASLWAAAWNKYDEDETPIPWIFPKKEES
jgi:hypothetical protein